MGIFSGSGVGKSVLLSMLARYTTSDVNVIGLVGEPPASKGSPTSRYGIDICSSRATILPLSAGSKPP